MSIFEKPKKVLKKGLVLEVSEHNAHKTKKITQKSVTIIFLNFCKNLFRDFVCKYIMDENTDIFIPKNPKIFSCIDCDYFTSNKKDYGKHLETIKHKSVSNTDIKASTNSQEVINSKIFNCDCGKKYKHRQSLYNHKVKCNILNGVENIDKDQPITKELVLQLIQQNQKLQEMLHDQHNKMFEIAKEGKSITNNTTNNNNNNQFNLNFFLNEECKDALNIMDFVDSLNVQLKDLEYTAKTGYAEGISNIFINGLSNLSVHKRPIHCSDSKREVLYIKDNGEWFKDDNEKSKLTKAIKIVGSKNMKQITEWQKAYPEYNDPKSKQNDKYMKMICNAMSGSTKEESEKNYDKIIRNIAREVVIDKSM